METYITDSLVPGIMCSSPSPRHEGFFFVEKKDKALNPCTDFRDRNKITIRNKYPLLLLFSAFKPLHGTTASPNWICIMVTTWFRWMKEMNMNFIQRSSGTLGIWRTYILHDFLKPFVDVYLSDILFFSKSLSKHECRIWQVLQCVLEKVRMWVPCWNIIFTCCKTNFLQL